MSISSTPDYSNYSYEELHEALRTVDGEAYPERLAAIEKAIQNYESSKPSAGVRDQERSKKWVAGFWSRIGALIVDTILLMLVGLLLGMIFGSYFSKMHGWEIFIGLTISLIYFGFSNSVKGSGMTLGKRMLDIKVVDKDNNYLSLERSFLRALILIFPGYIFQLIHFIFPLGVFALVSASIFAFVGYIGIFYFYIFNRNTRQALHDLIVRSFVVNANAIQKEVPQIWKPHFSIFAALCVVSLISPLFFARFFPDISLKKLVEIQVQAQFIEGINVLGVQEVIRYGAHSNGSNINLFSLNAQVIDQRFLNKKFAEQVVRDLIEVYPDSINRDLIVVGLSHGYNLGIWSSWRSSVYSFKPSELELNLTI